MNTIILALVALGGILGAVFMAMRAAIRMAEENGSQETESRIREAQEADARRRLKNVLDADARSRNDIHAGRLLDDDGHRRD